MRLCNPLGSLVTVPALLLAGLIGACSSKAPPSDAAIATDGLTSDGAQSMERATDAGTETSRECRSSCTRPPCVLAEGQPLPLRLVIEDRWVFWTTRGRVVGDRFTGGAVSRVEKTGNGLVVVAADQNDPTDLAVDAEAVYWATASVSQRQGDAGAPVLQEHASVRRAAKDGSGATVIARDLGRVQAVTVDDSHVYFEAIMPTRPTTDEDSSGLYAVPKTGGMMRRLSDGGAARGIISDGQYLYFARQFPGAILRTPKAGGDAIVVLDDSPNGPWPIAADESRLFWATYAGGGDSEPGVRRAEGTIASARRDGSDARRLFTVPPRLSGIRALALDGEHLYWVEHNELEDRGRVMRARKDGSDVTLLASTQTEPTDVVVDECSVFWTTLGSREGTGAVWSMPKSPSVAPLDPDASTSPEVRDASVGDATCAPTPDEQEARIDRRLVYTAPGCDAQATPVCERLVADAAVGGKLLCGCDGKTFQAAGSPEGRLLYSERPYRFEGCCPEDPPMFFTNQCTNLRDAAAQ
jgi:hypothetical protein